MTVTAQKPVKTNPGLKVNPSINFAYRQIVFHCVHMNVVPRSTMNTNGGSEN